MYHFKDLSLDLEEKIYKACQYLKSAEQLYMSFFWFIFSVYN